MCLPGVLRDASTTLASPTTASSPPTYQMVEDLRSSDQRSVKVAPFGRVPNATVLRSASEACNNGVLASSACRGLMTSTLGSFAESSFSRCAKHATLCLFRGYLVRGLLHREDEFGQRAFAKRGLQQLTSKGALHLEPALVREAKLLKRVPSCYADPEKFGNMRG